MAPIYRTPVRDRPLLTGPVTRQVGPLPLPPASEDHNTIGVLYLGAAIQAPVTKTADVTARLLIGAALTASITTVKDVTGLLSIGVLPRPGTAYRFPSSISGNKILDQNGDVFLLRTLSSWSMPSHLSDTNIAVAMGIAQSLNFNGVTCWMGGTEDRGGAGWDKYTNLATDNYWTGTPWAMDSGTTLGPAWSSVDKVVQEADARGIIVSFSFCSGFSTFGPGPDWDSVTNADMTAVGEAIATRYAAYDNIVWHVMYDDVPGATRVSRTNALFTGINNIEGTSRRPVRWTEVDNGNTTFDRSLYDPSGSSNASRFSVNCVYDYSGSSVVAMENVRTEITTGLIGDCEPRYDGNAYTTGNDSQQQRERIYTVFIEGGCLINVGNECWWPFGADPLLGSCTDWEGSVDTDTNMIEMSFANAFIDEWLLDDTYEATSAFIDNGSTGEGTGDTKAAQGAADTFALAYFPNDRTITVDTTILTGTGNVRLRWYDPVADSYSTITSAEAQQTGRSVTLPSARGDGTRDFILVADLVSDVNTTGRDSIGVDLYATVTKSIDVAALLSIGIQPLATTAHVADGASRLPIGVEPVSAANKAADGASTLPIGITPVSTSTHEATIAGLLPIGVSTRTLVTGDRTITDIRLPIGVTLRAVTDSSTEINTTGWLGLGLATMATVTHDANAVALLSVGVSPRALTSHETSVVGRLSIGVFLGAAPQGDSFNVCFEVGAPVFVDRAAVLAMVARILGDPSMVERSPGSPDMNLRDAALAMVDRVADVAFRDRSATLGMVDRTATVEMVDRELGEPRIACEE